MIEQGTFRAQNNTASPSGESQLPTPRNPQAIQQQQQHPHLQLTLATVNARGLCEPNKRRNFWENLRKLGADIICVQETKIQQGSNQDRLSEGWIGEVFWASSERSAAGVAILFSKNTPTGTPTRALEGRLLTIPFTWNGQQCTITCLYGPSTPSMHERNAFFEAAQEVLESAAPEGSLNFVAGDLNCFEDGRLDKLGGNPTSTAPATLTGLMAHLDVQDAFRVKHPTKKEYTWEGGDVASRLDKILVPTSMTPMITTARHHRVPLTDHKAVVIKLCSRPEAQIGKGYWMMRTTLLTNKKFKEAIEAHSRDNPPSAFPDKTAWIRDFINMAQKEGKDAGKSEAEKGHLRVAQLCRQLDKLWEQKRSQPPCQTLNHQIRVKRAELYSTYRKQHQEWKRLSAGKHIDMGDQCSRHFASLGKVKTASSTIPALRDPQGRIQEGTQGAIAVATNYYSTLYSPAPEDGNTRAARKTLLSAITRRLSEAQSGTLEVPIAEGEVRAALRSAPRNKSPGRDGLPAEFWASQRHLASPLADLFNEWIEKEAIPDEVNQGVITILLKKGDPADLKNYRPIALLPTLLKLFTRVLNTRLKKVITNVLGPTQTAAPASFIHTNTRLVSDVLEHLHTKKATGGVILLDAEKAFDMVNWDFLEEVMLEMNFGPVFRSTIRTLQENATSVIKVNNTLSEQIRLERGVRQGDTLSPNLFIINQEPFLNLIDTDPGIQGVELPGGGKTKVVAFADDTATFFSNAQDLDAIKAHMRTYEKATGARFNLAKTEGIVVGMPPPDNALHWTTDPGHHVRYLGIPTAAAPNNENQWSQTMKSFEECLSRWGKIPTTLHGKVAIIKHFALPTLTYALQALPCPESVQDRVQEMTWRFMWGRRKKAQVNRETCELARSAGGLGLPNFKEICMKTHSKWIQRVVDTRRVEPRPVWTALPEHHLQTPNTEWAHGPMAVHTKSKTSAKQITSPFWREVLLAHWRRSPTLRLNHHTATAIPLFGNNLIVKQDGGKLDSTRWHKWVESGITTVGDITQGTRLATPTEMRERCPNLPVSDIDTVLQAIPEQIVEALTGRDEDTEITYSYEEHLPRTPKGEQEWTHSLFPHAATTTTTPWTQTYKALWRARVPHKWKETMWLALRRSKYVGATAQRHGWNAHPHHCASCPAELETMEHAFIECQHAKEAWDWVDQTWTNHTGKRPPPHLTLNSSPLWQCLSLGAVQAIWQTRCARAHDKATSAKQVLKALLKRLHSVLGQTSPLPPVL